MRRFSKPLVVVLTVLTSVSTIVFYNMDARRSFSEGPVGALVYGQPVSSLEMENAKLRFEICARLQMIETISALAGQQAFINTFFGRGPSAADADNYTWNSLVLRHEAEALGLDATDAEIESTIKTLPAFQTNNAFDYAKYQMLQDNLLSHNGFTTKDLEQIIADQVRVQKVRALLGTTVHPVPSQIREAYIARNQKREASFTKLKLDDFKAGLTVTDDDIAKLFEQRKSSLNTPEKRKVKYVAFTMAHETKPLEGRERATAMQRLAEQAQNFAIAMTDKTATIESVAQTSQLPVKETPFFQLEEAPDELGRSPQASAAAFKLSKEAPASDVINSQNGYYVLQLADIEASRPLTLEEAKTQLADQLKQERAQEAMSLKAADIRTKIDTAIKAGQPFEEAAKTAGVTLEKIPAFSATENGGTPNNEAEEVREAKDTARGLKEGEVSEFVPTAAGGMIVHVDKLVPVDEAEFEKAKSGMAEQVARSGDERIFQDWLRIRRNAANIQITQRQG